MSFQGHEKKSSSKTIHKLTVDLRTRTVVNMPQIAPGLTTYYRASAGTNSFDCYNIRPWMPKRSFAMSKKNQGGFMTPSTNLFSRNPQVKTRKQLMQPWP